MLMIYIAPSHSMGAITALQKRAQAQDTAGSTPELTAFFSLFFIHCYEGSIKTEFASSLAVRRDLCSLFQAGQVSFMITKLIRHTEVLMSMYLDV